MAWGRSTVLNPHHQLFEFRGLVEHFLATPSLQKNINDRDVEAVGFGVEPCQCLLLDSG